ncbi:hypothetical protein CATMIT_01800, partial [Catenibacterium mitsuokai DSM 15897]
MLGAFGHGFEALAGAHALRVEGAAEGFAAAHEIVAALARQADPVEVVLGGVGAVQAVLLELVRGQDAQVAVGHGHHQVRDRGGHAVALQVIAHLLVDRAQLAAEFGARGRGGAVAHQPVDADLALDRAGVAGGQHQHAGAVADRLLAHPDRPARFGDGVAGAQ